MGEDGDVLVLSLAMAPPGSPPHPVELRSKVPPVTFATPSESFHRPPPSLQPALSRTKSLSVDKKSPSLETPPPPSLPEMSPCTESLSNVTYPRSSLYRPPPPSYEVLPFRSLLVRDTVSPSTL